MSFLKLSTKKNRNTKFIIGVLSTGLIISCNSYQTEQKIDRYALVNRHNIQLNSIDTLGSLTVGNGDFAYTVDITGMQTFYEQYENGISLGTLSNWGWHTIPTDDNYSKEDVKELFKTCGDLEVPYATQHNEGRPEDAAQWLRSNPHRLHLGIIGLALTDSSGNKVGLNEIEKPNQKLDLWTGKISSQFEIDGSPVNVETLCHQDSDQLSFRINSPLIRNGQLKIKLLFPYGKACHTCPGYDWSQPDKHTSQLRVQNESSALIKRKLDTTNYSVRIDWDNPSEIQQIDNHFFEIVPDNDQEELNLTIAFSNDGLPENVDSFEENEINNKESWEAFWKSGGAIDFSKCTDPRANELERRVVLSQYLTKIQCSGFLPPQETGLTMNSWFGKFHIEMHWWHGVHFALWNRSDYLENSLKWYFDHVEKARETAEWQGYKGVRWQKMTSPDGKSSPSSVGEFLVWQQPHIIYFAELLYQENPTEETLRKYQNIVFETAEFMASFAQYNEQDGYFHLCPPLIPAQEHFKATETSDPAFELSYWYWGLQKAREWNKRLGLKQNEEWQRVLDNLAPIPKNEAFYLPTAEAVDAYTNFDKKRDHPIVAGAYGFLPNERIDTTMMAHTFQKVMNEWNWPTTWGWDYPLLAMTATRLNMPEKAIEALFIDTQKNTYLVNGHNYQDDRLRLYLPGNGGLLTAVAMMTAGFEGSGVKSPGFPKNSQWNVKWEGLKPIF